MTITRIRPDFITTISEWVDCLSASEMTAEHAQTLYRCFVGAQQAGQLMPAMFKFLRGRYETDDWQSFIADVALDCIASKATENKPLFLRQVQIICDFAPFFVKFPDKLCNPENRAFGGTDYLAILSTLRDNLSGATPRSDVLRVCALTQSVNLGIPTTLEMLAAIEDPGHLWAMPLTALVKLFVELEENPLTNSNTTYGVQLANMLVTDRHNYATGSMLFALTEDSSVSSPAINALRVMASYSAENVYFRYMCIRLVALTDSHSWPEPSRRLLTTLFDSWAAPSYTDMLPHIMQVAETTPGSNVTLWLKTLFSRCIPSEVCPPTRAGLWRQLSRTYAENEELWLALGLTPLEMAHAVNDLAASARVSASSNTALIDQAIIMETLANEGSTA